MMIGQCYYTRVGSSSNLLSISILRLKRAALISIDISKVKYGQKSLVGFLMFSLLVCNASQGIEQSIEKAYHNHSVVD